MMKKDEPSDIRSQGHLDYAIDTAMPPSAACERFICCVLSVGDQQGGITDEFQNERFVRSAGLMIQKEDYLPSGGQELVSQTSAGMIAWTSLDLDGVDLENQP